MLAHIQLQISSHNLAFVIMASIDALNAIYIYSYYKGLAQAGSNKII